MLKPETLTSCLIALPQAEGMPTDYAVTEYDMTLTARLSVAQFSGELALQTWQILLLKGCDPALTGITTIEHEGSPLVVASLSCLLASTAEPARDENVRLPRIMVLPKFGPHSLAVTRQTVRRKNAQVERLAQAWEKRVKYKP